MAELITQRIRRNAAELRLHGISENPDELIDRAEAAQLGYREFLDLERPQGADRELRGRSTHRSSPPRTRSGFGAQRAARIR
jgi:hypothetical protein